MTYNTEFVPINVQRASSTIRELEGAFLDSAFIIVPKCYEAVLTDIVLGFSHRGKDRTVLFPVAIQR